MVCGCPKTGQQLSSCTSKTVIMNIYMHSRQLIHSVLLLTFMVFCSVKYAYLVSSAYDHY
jgi:hypothetical protein